MNKHKIPQSWTWTKLESTGKIVSGGTPSTSSPEYWHGDVSWISPVDLSKYNGKFISKGAKSITEEGLHKSSARLVPKGSVLFSSRAPIGYVAIAGCELCTNQGFKTIVPNDAVNNNFLYYFLKSAKKQAEELASGTTFKEISLSNFALIQIPLPPLGEQQRIVAKIEELFSELDKGVESLKTAQQQLKVYRQAVLKYAFEGKLTNPEVKEGELPEGWVRTPLINLCEINPKLPNCQYEDTLEVTFLPMKRVSEVINRIDATEVRAFSDVKKGFTPMIDGDVIFAKITPCMENGKIAVVHSLKNGIAFGSTEFHVFRCHDSILNTYIFHFLVQERTRYTAEENMTGAVGQRRVPKKFLEDYVVTIPSTIEEQQEIVQEIESRLSICDKIEETIQQGLQQAEALRQSILKKAFEGKLVPQDPNDEPASVLLDRIKAARAGQTATKK
jgi:type I restriction enzyme S subunit